MAGLIKMLSDKKYLEKIGFMLGERNRLDLYWSKVRYSKGCCHFTGAYFAGPVLQFAEKINPNDFILLDLYKQYFIFSSTPLLAKFSWGAVEYSADKRILLSNAVLVHDVELNKVPKLRNKDHIVIDTSGHDAATHASVMTYIGIVVDDTNMAYNFWNVEGRFRKV